MSNRAMRQPIGLKLFSNGFLALWCLIAAFPIVWIAVMSLKTPIDAFSSNPLKVIVGPHTRENVSGLSLIDIVLGLALVAALIYVAIRWLPGKIKALAPGGSMVFGWLIGGLLYGISVLIAMAVILPAVLGVLNPALGPLGNTVIGLTTEHYGAVWIDRGFSRNFANSMIVTVVSLFLILLFGSMAAFALAEYRFRFNTLMGLYLALGIMIPIRIGTVAILEMMVATGLVNTLLALILVYTAQGLPLAVFILSEFMRGVSDDLKNAGRIDGLSEYKIFFRLVLPLVRPAMATVAVFNMIPIWNDLWFPLILAPAEETKTLTLGSQVFIGQFVTDWNAVLSALSMAILPVMVLYVIFSRQLIRSIMLGAVK